MPSAYLDHAATSPLAPEARNAMLAWLGPKFGNPSGSHAVARSARRALEDARDQLAACLGAAPGEVVFTSGGTEADNLAVLGCAGGAAGGAVVCPGAEHHAVLRCVEALGGRVVGVGSSGVVDLDELAEALGPRTALVSVMLVNNEVGTVSPLAEIAALVREKAPGALLHTDAVAAFAWLDVAALTACCDLVSVAAHKFGGPPGIGALVVRGQTRLRRVAHGGGQERDRRPGTQNLPGAIGMAAAAVACVSRRDNAVAAVRSLRDRLADGLLGAVEGSVETVGRDAKVPGSCHMLFPGVESEALLYLLDRAGVAASAGSACASGAAEPSHVLAAMGLSSQDAASAVRFSLGPTTTQAEVDLALDVVPEAVARLRRAAPATRRPARPTGIPANAPSPAI